MCSVKCAVCGVQCAACGVRCVVCVCSVQCAVGGVQWAVGSGQWAVSSVQIAVPSLPCAVCRLPCAVCRLPCAVRSWLRPDFVDDASAVKLRTAPFGSCHTGRCIAYLLEFIYLSLPRSQSILVKLLAVSTCLPSLLLEFTLYMLLVCTHDFEFLDDETRVDLRLDKFCR